MAVRCALGYIQVGGIADDAADAAPSPSRFALGRRSQAHTERTTGTRQNLSYTTAKTTSKHANCSSTPSSATSFGTATTSSSLTTSKSTPQRTDPVNPMFSYWKSRSGTPLDLLLPSPCVRTNSGTLHQCRRKVTGADVRTYVRTFCIFSRASKALRRGWLLCVWGA